MAQPIEIHEYDPLWKQEFVNIALDLRKALAEVACRIDHIGSTSVEGLAAKPIIDIQISVPSLEPVSAYLPQMEALAYVWRSDNPEKTKRYFRESPGQRRIHIHVRRLGSWHEQFALLFRDYLRLHPDDQRKYERVKKELAALYRSDRQAYTDAKDEVFWEIIKRADRWASDTGWDVGAPDA